MLIAHIACTNLNLLSPLKLLLAGRATCGPGQHSEVHLASCGADEDAPGADLEETRARPVRAGPHAPPESGMLIFCKVVLFIVLSLVVQDVILKQYHICSVVLLVNGNSMPSFITLLHVSVN